MLDNGSIGVGKVVYIYVYICKVCNNNFVTLMEFDTDMDCLGEESLDFKNKKNFKIINNNSWK